MALTVGPDAVSDVPETVVLPMGRTKVSVRVADYPRPWSVEAGRSRWWLALETEVSTLVDVFTRAAELDRSKSPAAPQIGASTRRFTMEREKGVASTACQNCGASLNAVTQADGGTAFETCTNCYGSPAPAPVPEVASDAGTQAVPMHRERGSKPAPEPLADEGAPQE